MLKLHTRKSQHQVSITQRDAAVQTFCLSFLWKTHPHFFEFMKKAIQMVSKGQLSLGCPLPGQLEKNLWVRTEMRSGTELG